MHVLADDFATGTFRAPEPPCLSLYQPTHRSHPENAQDPIRFRNLVKSMEESLRQQYPKRDIKSLLQPFYTLADDAVFWNNTQDGLAVLASPDIFRVYKLQRPVAELAVVADSFHIKPLLRIVQSADRYQILGLSRQEVKLFEGNRDALDEIELPPDFPRTLADVIGESGQKPQPIRTHGAAGAGGRHGTASKADLMESDTEQFFRAVDRAVLENYSRPLRLPLVLAALPENQGSFRQLSHNPFLLSQSIDVYPDALSIDALQERAWRAVEPQYLERLAALVDMFGAARPHSLADADLVLISRNAIAGRIATLLLEADRHIPGRIDHSTGEIEAANLAHPEVDDLLDDLGELVLHNGGQVVIVPKERMPTDTGAAAIYRF